LLELIGIVRYKIPSGEVSNKPLLEEIAKTQKPVLLSSGMSTWKELDAAVATIRERHDQLCVMQCTSEYPCPATHVGLNIIHEMRERWRLPVGFSDHTLENYACFASVVMGAVVVEKHLTFSRRMYGSDAQHSAEPTQFADLVSGIRAISEMCNAPMNKNADSMREMKDIFEKSVVSVVQINVGTIISPNMVSVKKPGTGIPASRLNDVIGCTARHHIPADSLIDVKDIDGFVN
jgi:N-acetylneuraminate synthase